MSLNIKNEQVHALTRALAERTGKTQTGAIQWALERALGELDREPTDAVRRALINDLQQAASDADLDADSLYDNDGLPL